MDQWLVGSVACVVFMAFAVGWYIFNAERESRKVLRSGRDDIHSGPDDVETRSRKAY